MSEIRCNNCDTVFDTQKPISGTIIRENHGASDCPNCGGEAHRSRALLPHYKVVDETGRAIPDPKVAYVAPVPMASETYAQVQELISKLQGQLEAEKKRSDEMERSLNNLAKMLLRPSVASAVVEPPAVGPAHLAEAVKTVESPATPTVQP